MTISIRPHHDLVTLTPAPELHAKLHGIQIDGGRIMSELFGEVRMSQPVHYKVTGKLNQFAMGRVVRMGKGTATGQGQDQPNVRTGDVVGVDLGQVGRILPGGLWQTTWRNLLCVFRDGCEEPVPLMNRVMVEYDEKLVDRFAFQNQATKLKLLKFGHEDIKTNHRAHTNSGVTVGRVLAIGPGRFVKKVFEEVGVSRGEVVMFENTNGVVDFTFRRGQLLKFVPWPEVESSIDGLE